MSRYNASVLRLDPTTGQEQGVFLAEVNDAGQLLRSNWLQCTGLEGTPRYDEYLRRSGLTLEVLRDSGQHYKDRLKGLLPAARR